MTKSESIQQQITALDLLQFLKEKIILFLLMSIILSWVSFGASFLINDIFKSTAIIKILEPNNNDRNFKSSTSALGNLSNLAGLDLTSGGSEYLNYFKAKIASRNFFESLIADKQFSIQFIDEHFKKKERNQIKFSDLHNQFLETYDIDINKDNGYLYLSFKSIDPVFAKYALTKIYTDADNLIKAEDIKKANSNIEFINKSLNEVNYINLRNALNDMAYRQLNTLLMASSNEFYIVKLIENANLPDKKYFPSRILFLIGGFIFSILTLLFFRTAKFIIIKS